MPGDFKYWAFLSYSHQDNRKTGNRWADWLHEGIERFPVPREFIGRATRDGEIIPARLFPVFQDEKELPTNSDLGTAIQDALEQSCYLIVICSPRAARSVYVNQEVLEFKRLGRANRILAIIIDGEPNASEPAKGFDPALECFPLGLRHPLDPNGQLDQSRPAEPIAADVRSVDGSEASLADKNHRSQIEREKLRVIAGLLGIGFDDLVQRDKERQLAEERSRARRLRRLVFAFAALAFLTTIAGIIALQQRSEAIARKEEAQRNLLEAKHRLAQVYLERAEAAYFSHDFPQQALFLVHARLAEPNTVSASLLEDLSRRSGGAVWSVDFKTPLNAIALGANERSIFVGGDEGWIAEVETQTGRVLNRMNPRHGAILGLAASADGGLLASAHSDGSVVVWDNIQHRILRELHGHDRFATSVLFDPDGQTLFSTSDDRTVAAWNLADGTIRFRLQGHEGGVNRCAVSPDRKLLATAADDGTVRLWRADNGMPVLSLTGHQEDVSCVEFSSDGTHLVTAGGDGSIRVWDVKSGKTISALRGHESSISALGLGADSATLFSVGADKTIRMWDAQTGEERFRCTGHTGWIRDIALIARGTFVASCAVDGRLCLWATPFEPDARELIGHRYVVRRAAFSPDGKSVFTAGDDRTVKQWKVTDASFLGGWIAHEGPVTTVACSRDGKIILTASHDETLRLWDGQNHTLVGQLIGHSSLIWSAALDTDGKRALSGGADRAIRLWDLPTHKTERLLEGHDGPVNAVVFNSNGNLAASGGNDRVAIVWDTQSGRALRKFSGQKGPVAAVSFAPDSKELLTAAWDDNLHIWDLSATKDQARLLKCGAAGCDTATFFDDGKLVAAGGIDGSLRVWNSRTGDELRRIPAHVGRIYNLAVSPDGRHIVTCGLNGRARLWDLDPEQLESPNDDTSASDADLVHLVESRTGLSLVDGRAVFLPASSANRQETAPMARLREKLKSKP